MQDLRTKVVDRLKADATLYPGLVTGGIFDRALKDGNVPGATPEAFFVDPADPAKIRRLRPSIVVKGPNETSPTDGPIETGDPSVLRMGFLRINYYVPATATGKAALDLIDDRVRVLLHGWQVNLTIGYPVTFSFVDLTDADDSDEFPGNIQAVRRVVGEYFRPM